MRLCFFVEEKADAAVENVTLEDVVELTEDSGPRSGTLMKISPKIPD